MNITELRFDISTSTTPIWNTKKNAGALTFATYYQTDLEFLKTTIKQQHAFCHTYDHDGNTFSTTQKRIENFNHTNLMFFDFDCVQRPIDDFMGLMSQTEIYPNIAYTTISDGKRKDGQKSPYNNRYRFIYMLDKPITDNDTYRRIHNGIKNEIFTYTNDKWIYEETNDANVAQMMAGNSNAVIVDGDVEVYSLDFLLRRYEATTTTFPTSSEKRKRNHDVNAQDVIPLDNIDLSYRFANFITDYATMPFRELLHKYMKNYVNEMATPIEYNDDELIKYVSDDYVEIQRRWYIEKREHQNGNEIITYNTYRTRNGQQRRKTLYVNLRLRKMITPNITLDNLLFNAVYEVYHHIDNNDRDDVITRQQIARIAIDAYFNDKPIRNIRRFKMKVNKSLCKRCGINPTEVALNEGRKIAHANKKAKKEELNKAILSMYDHTKTNKENLQYMAENGLIISDKKLRNWMKENNITKYNVKPKKTVTVKYTIKEQETDFCAECIDINEYNLNKTYAYVSVPF